MPGIGLGVEYRMADGRLTGHALTLKGTIVHAAFFTRTPEEKRERRPVQKREAMLG